MSNQIITSKLFLELSLKQRRLVPGDAEFQLAGNHQIHKVPSLEETSTLGSIGSTDKSTGTTTVVNTAAQDLLQLGVSNVPHIVTLFSLAW
ncbi:MAG: CTB family bacteriocin [Goleter apudmare HA4340-LM2]|jgi:hypothetical protein|nr:CTB family bacteriocin [Goleter apudmare HA4340-LM2]